MRKRGAELTELLSAYLDGELADEQRMEVEALLADDAETRALLDEIRATVELVRSLPRAKASDDLMDGLRSRLERKALLGGNQPPETSLPAATPRDRKRRAPAAGIARTRAPAINMYFARR